MSFVSPGADRWLDRFAAATAPAQGLFTTLWFLYRFRCATLLRRRAGGGPLHDTDVVRAICGVY